VTRFPRPMTSPSDSPATRQVAWMAAGALGALVTAGLLFGLVLSWLLLDSRTTTPYRPGPVATLPERAAPQVALAPVAGPLDTGTPVAAPSEEPTREAPHAGVDGAGADLYARAGQDAAAATWPDGPRDDGPWDDELSDERNSRPGELAVSDLIDPATQRRTVNEPAPPAMSQAPEGTPPARAEPSPVTVSVVEELPLPTPAPAEPGSPLDNGIQAGLTVNPFAGPGDASGEATAPVATSAQSVDGAPGETGRTVIAGPLLHGDSRLDQAVVAAAPGSDASTAPGSVASGDAESPMAGDPLVSAGLPVPVFPGTVFPGTVFPGPEEVSLNTPASTPASTPTHEPPAGQLEDRTPVEAASGDALLLTLQREFPHPAGEGMEIADLLAPYPPIDKDSLTILTVSDSDALDSLFAEHGFNWLDAQDSTMPVPRILVGAFPDDIVEVNTLAQRKRLFFNTVLPIILQVNESILADRARLAGIRAELNSGHQPDEADAAFLAELAERYETGEADLTLLMRRVDVVPPSMALAQGAVESGWGTSSLARQGNALFGQITASADGLSNAGQGFRFAAFDTLYDSVDAYARNLNTHPAYRDFRALRAEMRRDGQPIDGYALIATLDAYSELGQDYITYIQRVMRANDLMALDDLRLEAPTIAEASL